MLTKRNKKGAALGLIIALTVVLAILAFAFFKMTLFFGAADETRNSTDAGALNVGKHTFDLSVQASSPEEHQFDDVADANHNFNLTNINRVWAKAMLAAANVESMALENKQSALALAHVEQLYSGAQSISSKLSSKLKDPNNSYQNFESITSGNNVRLASENSQVSAFKDSDWQTSYVDRGEDSNIEFDPNQVPVPLNVPLPVDTKSLKIPGYQEIPLLDKKFYLVSMKENERTHLINPEKFEKNTEKAKSFPGWTNPVPNAFSVHGITLDKNGVSSGKAEDAANKALSWVQVNPQHKFDLGIPRGYIKIKLLGNVADYTFTQQSVGQESYGYATAQQEQSYTTPEGFKVTYVPVSVGNEYNGCATLYQVLFPPSMHADAQHQKVMNVLLQRCREIKKGFNEAQLVELLSTAPVDPSATIGEYVIFQKNGKLVVSVFSANLGFMGQADGGTKQDFAPEIAAPSVNTGLYAITDPLTGNGVGPIPAMVSEHGTYNWTPGSGYDYCLGELSLKRTTTIAAAGIPQDMLKAHQAKLDDIARENAKKQQKQ